MSLVTDGSNGQSANHNYQNLSPARPNPAIHYPPNYAAAPPVSTPTRPSIAQTPFSSPDVRLQGMPHTSESGYQISSPLSLPPNYDSARSMAASWVGFVSDSADIAVLFEAAISGRVPVCERRPHDREKPALIHNGAVIIYDEDASGIKRWTDALSWSPSRVLGKFLVYREVNKTDATKKMQASKRPSTSPTEASNTFSASPHVFVPDELRSLVGSLVGTYDFKDDGLVKRTATCLLHGRKYHLVSYFTLQDYCFLRRPVQDGRFTGVQPSAAVLNGLRDGDKQAGPTYPDQYQLSSISTPPPAVNQYSTYPNTTPTYYAGGERQHHVAPAPYIRSPTEQDYSQPPYSPSYVPSPVTMRQLPVTLAQPPFNHGDARYAVNMPTDGQSKYTTR